MAGLLDLILYVEELNPRGQYSIAVFFLSTRSATECDDLGLGAQSHGVSGTFSFHLPHSHRVELGTKLEFNIY